MFLAALFVIARNGKQLKGASPEEQIEKMESIYTMEYCSPIKNQDTMNFAGKGMTFENIILSIATQSQKVIHVTHL